MSCTCLSHSRHKAYANTSVRCLAVEQVAMKAATVLTAATVMAAVRVMAAAVMMAASTVMAATK
jgi:hypothetical protein